MSQMGRRLLFLPRTTTPMLEMMQHSNNNNLRCMSLFL